MATKQEKQVPYGLKNGVLVGAHEVASGLACGAVCSVCNGPLVARKGPKRVFHFAHHTSCDCTYGPETSFHLMAKRIIFERKALVLPSAGSKEMLMLDSSLWVRRDVKHEPFFDEPFLVPARKAVFCAVQIEQQIARNGTTITPDLIVTDGDSGETILLEFLVTHAVDESKRSKVVEFGLSCLEIDLRPFLKLWSSKLRTIEEFPEWLIHELENKTWIHCHPLESRLDERRKTVQRIHAGILSQLERTRSTTWHRVPYEEWENESSQWVPVPSTIDASQPFSDRRRLPVTWRIDLDISYRDHEMRETAKRRGGQWDPTKQTWYYTDVGGVMSFNDQYFFSSIPTSLRRCAKEGSWKRLPLSNPPVM